MYFKWSSIVFENIKISLGYTRAGLVTQITFIPRRHTVRFGSLHSITFK